MEAVGGNQNIGTLGLISFNVSPDYIDIVGTGISVDTFGSVFTLTQPGLYHVEWSVNLDPSSPHALIGILEDGEPDSAITHSATGGNVSSGTLIYVEQGEEITVSLCNFSAEPILLVNYTGQSNVAASIRILKFADGPE